MKKSPCFQVLALLILISVVILYYNKTNIDQIKAASTVTTRTAPQNHGLHFVTYHHSIMLDSQNDGSSKFQDRVKEEMYVLQKNLEHPLVNSMHIIAANKTFLEKTLRKENVNTKKIIIYDNGRPPTMK